MSIREINLSPLNAGQLAKKQIQEAEQVRPASANRPETGKPAHVGDRVEISEAGRKASAGRPDSPPGLEFARKALSEAPGLDEQRRADILSRLANGYYSRQEVADVVASGLSATLGAEEA